MVLIIFLSSPPAPNLVPELVDPAREPNEFVARSKFGVPELVDPSRGPRKWIE